MKCSVNGVDLYFEKIGKGEALVLLHGNGDTHKIFDRAMPLLAEYFTVYAIDSRGHGESSAVSEFHYQDMAEDVKGFIDTLSLKNPILYGFSDGGIVGLLLAIKYPKMLSNLIISGANVFPNGIKDRFRIFYKIANAKAKNPRIEMMLNEPNITAEMLNKIESSTTVIVGNRDMIKPKHTKFIAENIKNSTLQVLMGEGHGSYVVDSAKIAKLILEIMHVK